MHKSHCRFAKIEILKLVASPYLPIIDNTG